MTDFFFYVLCTLIFFILIFKIQSDNYSVSVPFSSSEDGRCNYGDDGCDKDGSGVTADDGDRDYVDFVN